jgi:hypothetical protein
VGCLTIEGVIRAGDQSLCQQVVRSECTQGPKGGECVFGCVAAQESASTWYRPYEYDVVQALASAGPDPRAVRRRTPNDATCHRHFRFSTGVAQTTIHFDANSFLPTCSIVETRLKEAAQQHPNFRPIDNYFRPLIPAALFDIIIGR